MRLPPPLTGGLFFTVFSKSWAHYLIWLKSPFAILLSIDDQSHKNWFRNEARVKRINLLYCHLNSTFPFGAQVYFFLIFLHVESRGCFICSYATWEPILWVEFIYVELSFPWLIFLRSSCTFGQSSWSWININTEMKWLQLRGWCRCPLVFLFLKWIEFRGNLVDANIFGIKGAGGTISNPAIQERSVESIKRFNARQDILM